MVPWRGEKAREACVPVGAVTVEGDFETPTSALVGDLSNEGTVG